MNSVTKAFAKAKEHIEGICMKCHDPFLAGTSISKADKGEVETGFVFLGYDIRPGQIQPSKDARTSLLQSVDHHIRRGRNAILDVLRAENSFEHRQRYVQTLDLLDRIIRGWGNAFAYGNAPNTIDDLDEQIERKIAKFRSWYRRKMENADWPSMRRTGGVCLVSDVESKSLDALPYRIESGRKPRDTKNMIVVSTDGSVIGAGPRAGKDKGPGGWSAVFHNDLSELSGHASQVTNNQMELTAVIEALKNTPEGSRVKIRTDSQYVYNAAQKGTMIRSNMDLWDEYRKLTDRRRVDVVWVKGHAGDPQNERADRLALQQAKIAQRTRGQPRS